MWVVGMDLLDCQLQKVIQNRTIHMMDINERAVQLAQKKCGSKRGSKCANF